MRREGGKDGPHLTNRLVFKEDARMNPITLMDFKTSHRPRAYVNASVRFHHEFTVQERLTAAELAGWNVFQFPSEMLKGGDLLSDSGTTTLTAEQMSAMLLGDEAYGSNYGYFQLLDRFAQTFGISTLESEFYLFHQGRAAEHALFTKMGHLGEGLKIPNNGHFDTTFANITNNGIEPVNCFSKALKEGGAHPFKGNMDLEALAALLEDHGDSIPMVYLTITNNSGGGQPVSLENMRAVKALCDLYKKPFFYDACRFAENAWFIQQREKGYAEKSIAEIVHEVFALCDGFIISLKKDGLANMGGALLIRRAGRLAIQHPQLLNAIRDHQILTEGHPTYGGLSGRDIMTICEGLKTVVTSSYLENRIGQIQEFGAYCKSLGLPVLEPFGGHALYLDIDRFFEGTRMKHTDYGGIALTGLLLLKGVRLCELGKFAFGDDYANNFVRGAVPRNKYEIQDLYYVADCVKELHDRRAEIPRAIPVYGRDLTLRHFKARFELQPIV